MSQIELNKDLTMSIILTDQTDFTEEEARTINALRKKSGDLDLVEVTLKKAVQDLRIKLTDNPDYAKMCKFEEKLKVAHRIKNETKIILNNEYKKLLSRQGTDDEIANIFAESLPEAPIKLKRGRKPGVRS